jgi:hypothetical protein
MAEINLVEMNDSSGSEAGAGAEPGSGQHREWQRVYGLGTCSAYRRKSGVIAGETQPGSYLLAVAVGCPHLGSQS